MRINSDDFTLADFHDSEDGDVFAKTRPFLAFIEDMREKGTYTYRRVLTSACGSEATVRTVGGEERRMVMMASNNYLGLNTRPEVIRAAREAVEKYGTGLCGAPLLNGTFDLLTELEGRLARFVGCEDALVFASGYQANVGAISALMREKDAVVIDRLSHASIVDGCKLAGCALRAFKHNDTEHLDKVLGRMKGKQNGQLIVVDGVFSMDGNMARLPELLETARRHGARLMVDEAHALGVLGATGAGTVEHFGLQGKVDLIMGTFSKTLAATGGFVASTREVVNYIRHYARSYFFSASPTPATVGTVMGALDIIETMPGLRRDLWDNIRYFHAGLKRLGLEPRPDPPESAVVTVVVGGSAALRAISRLIHTEGVYLNSVEYPAVAKCQAKLRMGVMATHTRRDLDFVLGALGECRRAADGGERKRLSVNEFMSQAASLL